MKHVWIAVLVMACGGASAKPPAPIRNTPSGSAAAPAPVDEPPPAEKLSNAEQALMKYKAWTVEMCACPTGDTACAKKVTDAMIVWGEAMAKQADTEKPDPREAQRMATAMRPIMDEFTKCSMNAMTPPASTVAP
jgi:hypothetical protein